MIQQQVGAHEVQRIERLEKFVLNLSNRIEQLEGQPQRQSRQISASKTTWRKLRLGMTKNQVRNLLGEPVRIDGGAVLTYWYYSKKSLGPKVLFDPERVYGWEEPK